MTTTRLFLGVLLAATLAACGGGGGGGDGRATVAGVPSAPARPVPQSDLEIADLLYTDTHRVPSGFYVEPARYDSAYATITHLRNTDLDAAATPAHELCSDDPATALGWSEQVAAAAPVYGDLVETNDAPGYHEFVRALRVTPARHVIARVYKCAWLNRDAVDLAVPTGPAGRFGLAGWTALDLQHLGEYLWTFTADDNSGHAVLQSRAVASAGGATHSIWIARLTRATQGCDRVDVLRLDLTGESAGGLLTRTDTALWNFGASRSGGITSLCS